jgi:hypothetical protein
MTLQLSTALLFSFLGLSGPIILIAGSVIYFGLPVLLFFKGSNQKMSDGLAFKKISFKNTLYSIILSISIYPFAVLLSAITSLFFTNHVPGVVEGAAMTIPPLMMFTVFALSPAFFEEILLRGLLGEPLKRLGFRGALLNGLYFGLIHLNPHQFFLRFFLRNTALLSAYFYRLNMGAYYLSFYYKFYGTFTFLPFAYDTSTTRGRIYLHRFSRYFYLFCSKIYKRKQR